MSSVLNNSPSTTIEKQRQMMLLTMNESFTYLVLYEFKQKKDTSEEEAQDEYEEANRGKRKRASRSPRKTQKKAKVDDRNFNSTSFGDENMQLRLKIPISVLKTLSSNPLAWMSYVATAILGVKGEVPDPYADKDQVEDGDVFQFVVENVSAEEYTRLTKAVDLGTILRRTQSSTATSLRLDFHKTLLPRDGGCIFSPRVGLATHAAHLIPFARQNLWLKLLDDKRGTKVRDIDDIRNGIIIGQELHSFLDARHVAILPSPNTALNINDIPRNESGRQLLSNQTFPKGRRYTMQWLVTPAAGNVAANPHNRDAAFVDTNPEILPSTQILDYIYGASVLQQMGEATDGLDLYKDVQERRRPTIEPSATAKYKARTEADCQDLAENRGEGAPGGSGEPAWRSGGSRGWTKLTAETADAWMLYFRMKSGQAAGLLEEREHTQPESIQQWSRNVTSGVED